MPHRIKHIALGLTVVVILVLDIVLVYRNLVEAQGTHFDYYMVWMGANEFWKGGIPYTDQIAKQIQIGILGHPAAPNEIQYYFPYPAYMALLIFPFPLLPFVWSVTGWLVLQQILLVGVLMLMWQALDWKLTLRGAFALAVAMVVFRYVWIELVLAQTSIVVLFLIALALYASRRGHERWAAFTLAAATIKPQLAFLPILGWLATMAARRQLHAPIVFFASLLVLFVLPFFFVRDWLAGFVSTLTLYPGYSRADSPLTHLAFLLPAGPAWAITAAGGAFGLGYLLWVAWRKQNQTMVQSLSILLTLLLIPLPFVYDICLVLLPWLVCCHALAKKRGWNTRALLALLGAMPILSWTTITILPGIFDHLDLPFDVIFADKFLIPVLALGVFIYAERSELLEQ
jgi:hypothetical protein